MNIQHVYLHAKSVESVNKCYNCIRLAGIFSASTLIRMQIVVAF